MPSGTRRLLPYALLATLPLLLAQAPLRAAPPPVTALVGATVIHPEHDAREAVSPDSTVLLRGERISAVGPSAEVAFRPAELMGTVR